MIAPLCRDCPNIGCGSYHDRCPTYQEYKAKLKAMKEKKNLDNEHLDYVKQTTARYRTNSMFKTHKK